jgi:hypothetical protein
VVVDCDADIKNTASFSELMPIIFNVVFGLPQILSNIQMIIICVAVRQFGRVVA